MRLVGAGVIATALALLSASPVDAHGSFLATEVCGPGGCRSLGDGLYLYREHGEFEDHDFKLAAIPTPGDYYELEVRDFSERAFFVPDPGVVYLMEIDGPWLWVALDVSDARLVRGLAAGLEPYQLGADAVLVKGNEAEDPDAYVELYEPMPPSPAPPKGARRFEIVFRPTRKTPWTDSFNRFVFVPSPSALHQDGMWVRPPAALARLIERDAGLVAGKSDWDRPLVMAALGGALVLAAASLAFGLRRKRERRA